MRHWLLAASILLPALTFTSPALADLVVDTPGAETPAPAPTAPAVLDESCADDRPCATGLRCKDGKCAQPAISYQTYKTVHLASIITLLLALGGLIFLSLAKSEDKSTRRLATILHGVAMILLLVGGFGLMARLGVKHGEPWPNWIRIKFAMWFMLGAYVVVPKRLPSWNRKLWPLAIGFAALAAASAIHKF